jgi:hypothetical protein
MKQRLHIVWRLGNLYDNNTSVSLPISCMCAPNEDNLPGELATGLLAPLLAAPQVKTPSKKAAGGQKM